MTQTFSSDENNDLFIATDGNLSISDGLDAVLFACQTAAQAQLGEMVLAIDKGVPNFQTIWRSSGNLAQFEAYLRATLAAVDGVREITQLTTQIVDNSVSYQATIVTNFGAGQING